MAIVMTLVDYRDLIGLIIVAIYVIGAFKKVANDQARARSAHQQGELVKLGESSCRSKI